METNTDYFVPVGCVDDIPSGEGRLFTVATKSVAVFHVEGRFFALNNICPHEGGPLVKGKIKGWVVSCPWHDLQFDIRSGYGTDGGGQCVATYEVKVEGNQLLVSRRCRQF